MPFDSNNALRVVFSASKLFMRLVLRRVLNTLIPRINSRVNRANTVCGDGLNTTLPQSAQINHDHIMMIAAYMVEVILSLVQYLSDRMTRPLRVSAKNGIARFK